MPTEFTNFPPSRDLHVSRLLNRRPSRPFPRLSAGPPGLFWGGPDWFRRDSPFFRISGGRRFGTIKFTRFFPREESSQFSMGIRLFPRRYLSSFSSAFPGQRNARLLSPLFPSFSHKTGGGGVFSRQVAYGISRTFIRPPKS